MRLIAFQIGGKVSLQEIGKQLLMSKNTVDYLDMNLNGIVLKNEIKKINFYILANIFEFSKAK